MNKLYKPACLASSYTPISKREHIKPRRVMPSFDYEWLKETNAIAEAVRAKLLEKGD